MTCRQSALCKRRHVRCDCCGRMVHSVRAIGRDANGEPDAPDACVVCERKARDGTFARETMRIAFSS